MHKRGVVGYSKKSALLEEAITHMNTGKYGRSSAALKELLALDPHNTEARRLFATLHLRLGSLVTARQAFESLANEAIGRQDFWLAESLLREYLAAGPRCVPFLELLAHVYEEKGDSMAAVAELGKAIDILIEDPDSESPKKPSQLYAKVRELAPASSVAFQFASLFDIQTGEFLGPHAVPPTPATPLEIEISQPQCEIPSVTEESRPFDVMPWEQFDGSPPNPDPPSFTSPNPVIESINVPDALTDLVGISPSPQELFVLPSDSPGPIPATDPLGQDILPEPLLSSDTHCDDSSGHQNGELATFEGGTLIPAEEQTTDIVAPVKSSAGTQGLSSPMPWEQIENSTIRIEAVPPSVLLPPTHLEPVSVLGDESAFASPAWTQSNSEPKKPGGAVSTQDLTEPSESIFAVTSSTIPPLLTEPDATTEISIDPLESEPSQLANLEPVSIPSEHSELILSPDPSPDPRALSESEVSMGEAVHSPTTVPFSWNAVFDKAWKFAAGTSSSSSPASLSEPDTISEDARKLEPDPFVPPPQISTPYDIVVPQPQTSFSASDSLPSAQPMTLSTGSDLTVEVEADGESDIPRPTAVPLSEEPLPVEESMILPPSSSSSLPGDAPSSLMEQGNTYRESETNLLSSFTKSETGMSIPEISAPEPLFSVAIPETPALHEPLSTEYHEISITHVPSAAGTLVSAGPSDAPAVAPASNDMPSHWSTGEVEVQPHRPSERKRNWDKDKGEATIVPPTSSSLGEEDVEPVAEPARGWESAPSETAAFAEKQVVPQEDTRPEWVRASESINFVNPSTAPSATWQDSGVESIQSEPGPMLSVASSAVDVLFDSTGQKVRVHTQDRALSPKPAPLLVTRLARVRIEAWSIIGSCFTTTRSIALLGVAVVLSCIAFVAVGIGAVGVAWMVMEAPPSAAYHNIMTVSAPRPMTDSRKNGYLFLLGFDAPRELDPSQAPYVTHRDERSELQSAKACMVGAEEKGMLTAGASANVIRGWFASPDPVAQLKPQLEAVRSWAAQESVALRRYQQWLSMPFEDVGYGQILSPNCARILSVHRLYLAEGFSQDLSTGLGRLEADMGSWRTVLGQSKTLMVKMLAVTAIQDDVAVASGLLVRQELDGSATSRLGKIVHPLDQVESSLRWPMQSHFAWATKTMATSLKNDKAGDRPFHVAVAAAMPLPVQRRFNAYADYYEAASKAVAEGRYASLPKLSMFLRTPAVSAIDYLANPIEHIIGIEPLPSWDPYVGRVVETDARLRLASLQVWIRQGPQEGNLLTRLAKTGQSHYDPFTGLPMLVNLQKGVMYSVGQDGTDQEGDLLRDVVATIPTTQAIMVESSRSVSPPRSK